MAWGGLLLREGGREGACSHGGQAVRARILRRCVRQLGRFGLVGGGEVRGRGKGMV